MVRELKVGDIVRRSGGWTPMAVVAVYEGNDDNKLTYLADYCGEYFSVDVSEFWDGQLSYKGHEFYCSDDFNFVFVTAPEEEFNRCSGWKSRLNAEQNARLESQRLRYIPEMKTIKQGTKTMKSPKELMNIAALTSDDLTTVKVAFNQDSAKRLNMDKANTYTFICLRSLALQMVVNRSQVLCNTVHGIGIATVVEVHKEVSMEVIDEYQFQWVFGIVDTDLLKRLSDWQTQVAQQLSDAQRRVTKRSALAALGIEETSFLSLSDLLSTGSEVAGGTVVE